MPAQQSGERRQGVPVDMDLNADVGEGAGEDALLMPVITSASIACGLHAGDAVTMRETVALARAHGVAIGAHPSFADREGFGRKEMHLPPRDVEDLVVSQIGTLAGIAASQGVALQHVKPHGALYNMAARDAALADAIARAVAAVDSKLILFGLPGSQLVKAGKRAGLRTASEGFADRAYEPDGSLVPRTQPGAVIHDVDTVVANAIAMARDRRVDTICVHGDTPDAANLARRIREGLAAAGIQVARIGARLTSD